MTHQLNRRLIEVKNALKHGEFNWDKYTPSRYIKIAEEMREKLHYGSINN